MKFTSFEKGFIVGIYSTLMVVVLILSPELIMLTKGE